jgi:hypothetical protein
MRQARKVMPQQHREIEMEEWTTPKTGKLSGGPSRSDGKAVDEWTFHTARPSDRGNESIEIKVKVSLVKAKEGLAFRASLPQLGTFEDSDIRKLHQTLEQTLIKHSAVNLGAVWEDWLEVTVSNDDWRERTTLSSSLSIEVKPVKRGVDPKTGIAYLLSDYTFHCIQMGKEPTIVSTEAGGMEIRLNEKKEVSYVPATPENIAALTDARDRMIQLRQRLAVAFSQGQIGSTLEKIGSSLLALAAPDEAQNDNAAPARKGPRP